MCVSYAFVSECTRTFYRRTDTSCLLALFTLLCSFITRLGGWSVYRYRLYYHTYNAYVAYLPFVSINVCFFFVCLFFSIFLIAAYINMHKTVWLYYPFRWGCWWSGVYAWLCWLACVCECIFCEFYYLLAFTLLGSKYALPEHLVPRFSRFFRICRFCLRYDHLCEGCFVCVCHERFCCALCVYGKENLYFTSNIKLQWKPAPNTLHDQQIYKPRAWSFIASVCKCFSCAFILFLCTDSHTSDPLPG